ARKPARLATKKRAQADRRRPARSAKGARSSARPSRTARSAVKAPAKAAKPSVAPAPPPTPPQPPPRKPTYHEAVAMYERGLQALQRRDFAASADAPRAVLGRYPDERELLERARPYLKGSRPQPEPKGPPPQNTDQ